MPIKLYLLFIKDIENKSNFMQVYGKSALALTTLKLLTSSTLTFHIKNKIYTMTTQSVELRGITYSVLVL